MHKTSKFTRGILSWTRPAKSRTGADFSSLAPVQGELQHRFSSTTSSQLQQYTSLEKARSTNNTKKLSEIDLLLPTSQTAVSLERSSTCETSKPILPHISRQLVAKRRILLFEPPGLRERDFKHRHFKGLNPSKDPFRGMYAYVQFITTPTDDTPSTTLVLHFDSKRYLIGHVGEGTQRACIQRKVGLLKVEDIFLTGKVDWKTTGGLLGMILTISDTIAARKDALSALNGAKNGKATAISNSRLVLHGAENSTHLLATARKFVFRKSMPFSVDEFRKEDEVTERDIKAPTWSDANVQVWAMSVSPDEPYQIRQRKRSHEEMLENDDSEHEAPTLAANETAREREDRYDQIRKGVVADMFESDWRLDTLRAVKLGSVQMPAKIFIREGGKIQEYNGPQPGSEGANPDLEVLTRTPWPGANTGKLPPTTRSSAAVSYIFKNYPSRGKFDAAEARRLGVTPGRSFGKLSNGESVTTKNGNVVTPEMVLPGGRPGGAFAVIDIPSVSYVKGLLKRKELASDGVMDGVSVIVWILGEGVIKDKTLLAFMKQNSSRQHIVSSTDCCRNGLALESPASAAVRLNLIDSERFPIPFFNTGHKEDEKFAPLKQDFEIAEAGKMIQVEPSVEIQSHQVVSHPDLAEVVQTTPEEVLLIARDARERINDPAYQAHLDELQNDLPSRDAEVITLGTGSSLPSKYRNVSATLLRVPGYGNYLFDCGENTLGQLKRVFGPELPDILNDLKVIWISHLHADHHLGTVSLIKAWHEETKNRAESSNKKLAVACGGQMHDFLEEYAEIEDFGHDRVQSLTFGHRKPSNMEFDATEHPDLGLVSIVACFVSHCNDSMGVVFNFANGFKVAYSGDCRPSNNFVQIGQGATLLIHEATFDDELRGDAIAKKHSTTSEALRIGRDMGARRILLTHFSQRYQKIPVMDSGKSDQVAIVAFDYMRCKLGDFAKLSEFRPALAKLFEENDK